MSADEKTDFNPVEVLQEYVRNKSTGEILDYVNVQKDTGIEMTPRSGGRRLLRIALKREGLIFSSLRGVGVELSSATNAASFARDGIAKIVRVSKRENRRNIRLIEAHADDPEMPERDKQCLIATASFHGALRASAACALSAAPEKKPGERPPPPVLPFRRRA